MQQLEDKRRFLGDKINYCTLNRDLPIEDNNWKRLRAKLHLPKSLVLNTNNLMMMTMCG
jgi:hypothetical protein